MHVLVIEDDPALGAYLSKGLRAEGHQVDWFSDPEAAREYAVQHQPRLAVLDMDLKEGSGSDLLAAIHGGCRQTAVLALTSSERSADRVRWLSMGADDCLRKPFSFEELSALCMAMLRRQQPQDMVELTAGCLSMNLVERRARYCTEPLELTTTEFQLLEYLLRKRGECCSRTELLSAVWNSHPDTITNVVNVYVNYLRQKLAAAQARLPEEPPRVVIDTVRGEGYRLRIPSIAADIAGTRESTAAMVAVQMDPVGSGSVGTVVRGRPSNLLLRKSARRETANAKVWWEDSPSTGRRVLIVSADEALRSRLAQRLIEMRWRVGQAWGGAEAMGYLGDQTYDTVLVDHWLPDLEVEWFKEEIARIYTAMSVMPIDGDVAEIQAGGPWRHELLHALREAQVAVSSKPEPVLVRSNRLPQPEDKTMRYGDRQPHDVRPGRETVQAPFEDAMPIDGLIGDSMPMRELTKLIRMVAPQQATVLIEGETGTGKELVAQAIHMLGNRATKPYVVLNCAAIPESLLETELFGHTKGAFTGADAPRIGRIEAANGGTLFLDEIAELPLTLQAKLLRFLENGEVQRVGSNEVIKVDVRVIAATHQRLEEHATSGAFRLDLYHRLAVFPIEVASLRDRKEDIPALSEYLLTLRAHGALPKRLSNGALQMLMDCSWTGNVRELAHVLERAVILAGKAEVIEEEHIRLRRRERE